MVEVSGITMDYGTFCNMIVGQNLANEEDCLKYQAIYIGPYWESRKITVYTKIKVCCLYGEGRWLFPHHICGSLSLLRCLHRGVWVVTAIY